jgi:glycosyltransferase involved in cell wall biosynthesis
VTMVLNWAALGGAERRALTLARWLREAEGAHVEVLALTDRDGRAVEVAHALGIPWRSVVVDWDGGQAAKAADLARFARFARRGNPDILMSFCSLPNVLCGLSWPLTGAATSVWYQADVSPFRRARDSTRRRAARSTPVLVAGARHSAEHLVREWGAAPNSVRVVYAGVEPREPALDRSAWRSQLGIDDDVFVACMVAHFRRSKDHATLLRAWRVVADELAREGRRAVLLLAGDPMQSEAKALAYDLRLDESVRFLGIVDDVAGLVGSSDLSVLSSLREGLGTSILESMAAGIPIAGTDISGIREAVGEEAAPYLAPPADAPALADILLLLARDAGLRARFGEACARRVRREFTVERMLASYRELLVGALASRSRARPRLRRPR